MTKQNQKKTSRLVLSETQINSLAGATSGIFTSVLVSPLDVVKTRIQVKRLPKGVPDTPLYLVMYRLREREGFRAFYKGLGATMLGYAPNWALYFTTYQWAKKQFGSWFSSLPYEHDVLTNIFASVTAGAISNTIIAPLWTVRTRMMTQMNHDDYRNPFHALQKIYKTEGIQALYRGVVPSMLGLIHVAVQFPLYEYLKSKCAESSPDKNLSTGQLIFASSVSKLLASCAAYPHEIVRSRLQDAGHARRLQQQSSNPTTEFRVYSNVRDAIKSIAREEGFRGFYRGLQPTLMRTVPAAVLTLLTYEKMRQFLTENFSDASSE